MATSDPLARLGYPNFEVLVIDNNTVDAALWAPVEAHCEALGGRLRFFHVEGLTAAKAGALNFALRHTDLAAELVAVVDADYQVEASFLAPPWATSTTRPRGSCRRPTPTGTGRRALTSPCAGGNTPTSSPPSW